MKKKNEGAISIFLALAMIIIFSLITSMLEAARYTARDSYSEILLRTATESVLGEFYGPLFEEYHLYGIDTGFGKSSMDIDELEKRIESYIGENVWDFSLKECEVTGYAPFVDTEAKEFMNQAYEYEKYAVAGGIAENLLKRLNILSDYGSTVKIYERTVEMEEQMAELDKYTIDLMREIDGVDINQNFFRRKENYKIKPVFLKQIQVPEINNREAVNNPILLEEIRHYFVNPISIISDVMKLLPEIIAMIQKMGELKESAATLGSIIAERYQEKSALEGSISQKNLLLSSYVNEKKSIEESDDTAKKKKKKIAALDSQINDVENEIKELVTALEELNTEISVLQVNYAEMEEEIEKNNPQKQPVIWSVRMDLLRLRSIVENANICLSNIEDILENIESKRIQLKPEVMKYEAFLNENSEQLSVEMKNDLNKTLELMKEYVGISKAQNLDVDFELIKRTVNSDKAVIGLINSEISLLDSDITIEKIQSTMDELNGIEKILKSLSYEGMYFDYSGLTKKSGGLDFETVFSEGFVTSILKLVLGDNQNISEDRLSQSLLPSQYYELLFDGDAEVGADTEGIDLFKTMHSQSNSVVELQRIINEDGNEILEDLVTEMYYLDHFKSFIDKEHRGDTVLEYEMEYILCGATADSINAMRAANKLLLLRFILSSAYGFFSNNIRNEAKILATAVMGFIGLPFLIAIVQGLIILVWSFVQAMVETAAIMKGKKVSLLTNQSSFVVSLTDIPFVFSIIQSKSEDFPESSFYLTYEEYLLLFLLFQNRKTQAIRAMDIIQENIRYKYNEDFLLFNTVVGFDVKAEFEIKTKYTQLFEVLLSGKFGSKYGSTVYDSVGY